MPKIVAISDTHNQHKQIDLPEGDILVHAGDICGHGNIWELESFCKWLKTQTPKFEHTLVVAGNHDKCLEGQTAYLCENMIRETGATYLRDSGVNIEGLNFWGSPVTPYFFAWAFNIKRGKLHQHWDLIPDDTDVLITHGPPMGTLDLEPRGLTHVGCSELAARIENLKQLKLHIFGHLHLNHGVEVKNGVTYVNAATCTEEYKPTNKPIVVEI